MRAGILYISEAPGEDALEMALDGGIEPLVVRAKTGCPTIRRIERWQRHRESYPVLDLERVAS